MSKINTDDTSANTVDALRDAGYLVIVFSPDEVGDADQSRVEDRLTEMAWEVIEIAGGPGSEDDE
jgi:hypothetical protein